MERKRNRLEVIRDILRVISSKREGVKPTRILYKSNLSHAMMKDYLGELLARKLIIEIQNKNSRIYSITPKGNEYLLEYGRIVSFMDTFGLEQKEKDDE